MRNTDLGEGLQGFAASSCIALGAPIFSPAHMGSLPYWNPHKPRLLQHPDWLSFIPQRQLLCPSGHSHEKHSFDPPIAVALYKESCTPLYWGRTIWIRKVRKTKGKK